MDELFTLVCTITFLLSLVISSLCALLVWIAFPDIARYKFLMFVAIVIMSFILTIHYAKQDYNPDKRYASLAERYHGFEFKDITRK